MLDGFWGAVQRIADDGLPDCRRLWDHPRQALTHGGVHHDVHGLHQGEHGFRRHETRQHEAVAQPELVDPVFDQLSLVPVTDEEEPCSGLSSRDDAGGFDEMVVPLLLRDARHLVHNEVLGS